YLIEKAKAEKDWEEAVPYEKKTRGKVFVPKKVDVQVSQKELADMGFDVELDEDVNDGSLVELHWRRRRMAKAGHMP
ncbi:unnamed protein product, partial [Echinostoma caproni]|uniref:Ribosome biogenesis regulatory protein n=1 Tax=Echinostoma caproni TaxID=27848 RepID=A0A183BFQ1_9TREM